MSGGNQADRVSQAGAASLAMSLALLIGCSKPAEPAEHHRTKAGGTTVAATHLPPAKPAAGCADAIRIDLDEASLQDAQQSHFPAARLGAFRTRVAAELRTVADQSCRSNAAVAKRLAAIDHVLIQSGAGASEPTFYIGEGGKPGTIILQWVFNETDLGVPDRGAIALGLRCWADRGRHECADMGD